MNRALRRICALLLCMIISLTALTSLAHEYYREREAYSEYIDFSPYISKSHPRLYVSSFENLKTEYMSDPVTKKWYEVLIKDADNIVNNVEPAEGFNFNKISEAGNGKRIIATQDLLRRYYVLAFAAGCEQNREYADRLWEEIELAAALPHWNTSHWLEPAEFIHSFAIAYDWCYNFWTEEQKKTIKDAMIEKGLSHAVREYNGYPRWYKWFKGLDGYSEGNNWSFVCNTGILFGALVLYDDTEYTVTYSSSRKTYTYNWNCNDMINNAIRAVMAGILAYDEDGSYEESFAYWRYATENLVMNVSGFENAIGGNFDILPEIPEPFFIDLSLAPGVSITPEYPIYANGPAGVFCFGDTSRGSTTTSPAMMWIANRFNVPHYKQYHLDMMEKLGIEGRNIPLNLLWYGEIEPGKKELPVDRLFEDDFAVIKDKWGDDALYFALKGGVNGRPHQHWDIGTFMFDVFGMRYGKVIGASNYKWEDSSSKYYLKRPEGQNTIVINPDESIGQDTSGTATFTSFYSGEGNAYAILDMTDAYDAKQVTVNDETVNQSTGVISAKRGVKMFKNKTRIILQDEIKTESPSEIYWFMHTDASIGFRNDNKTAVLTQSGKTVYLNIVSNEDVVFEKMTAANLETSPEQPSDQPASYGSKLAIHATGVTDFKLAVEMVPIASTVPSFTTEFETFENWHPEKDVVVNGTNVKIYGTEKKGRTVTMVTTSPSGAVVGTGEMKADAKGEFLFEFSLPGNYENGTYNVKVNGTNYKTFKMSGGRGESLQIGKPSFTCGEKLKAGNTEMTVVANNDGSVSGNLIVFAAIERGGRIIDIKCQTDEIAAYGIKTFKVPMNIPSADCKVKVYVLNNGKKNILGPAAERFVIDSAGNRYE